MTRAALLLLAALCGLFFSCSSVAVETYPQRRCLYDRLPRTTFRTGSVIARRDDGARLFRFDDPSWGDHGFLWIDDGDSRLRPCREASLSAAPDERTKPYDPSPDPDQH